jgi:RNA polymerase sigma factor (sigma-70 family)
MERNNEFLTMMERIKQGDEEAATALVRMYEPELRRFIRFRMTSSSVRRFVDSLDICQSVLARFFVHLTSDNVDVATPSQLRALLITMARNRTFDAVASQHAQRRDVRRTHGSDEPLSLVADSWETPSRVLEMEEIVSAVREAMSDEDRYLVDQRMIGREWPDLAQEFNTTAEAMRKRVMRCIDKAAENLGLAEDLA